MNQQEQRELEQNEQFLREERQDKRQDERQSQKNSKYERQGQKDNKYERQLIERNEELINDLQRTRADFENFRKQVEAQREQAKTATKHSTMHKILPLIDDMSRAIKAHPDTLSPVQKTLEKVLKLLNLEIIEASVGTVFNPEVHNAVSMEDDEGGTEIIAEELIPGYTYEGEVLRAAMVRVKHKQ